MCVGISTQIDVSGWDIYGKFVQAILHHIQDIKTLLDILLKLAVSKLQSTSKYAPPPHRHSPTNPGQPANRPSGHPATATRPHPPTRPQRSGHGHAAIRPPGHPASRPSGHPATAMATATSPIAPATATATRPRPPGHGHGHPATATAMHEKNLSSNIGEPYPPTPQKPKR
jgi:hypothetical protein